MSDNDLRQNILTQDINWNFLLLMGAFSAPFQRYIVLMEFHSFLFFKHIKVTFLFIYNSENQMNVL